MMKYSAIIPPLIACLVTVHADFNSILSIRDLYLEDSDIFSTISISSKDDGYEELLHRSHRLQEESEQLPTQWRDFNIKSSNHQPKTVNERTLATRLFAHSGNSRQAQQSTTRQDDTALPQSTNLSLPTRIHTRDVELQEDLINLRTRSPPKDAPPNRAPQGSRSASPPRSEQRTSTLANQRQQRTFTGWSRVHVLQPLTFETLSQIRQQSRTVQVSGGSRRVTRASDESPPGQSQQRQRNNANPSSSNAPLIPSTGDHSQNGAQMSTGGAGLAGRSSSTSSLEGKSDSPTAIPEALNRELGVESRSTHQGNGLEVTSPSPASSRRRRREEVNQPSASIINSGRSTVEWTGRRAVDDPMSPSSSENGPIARRRRLRRRSSNSEDQQQNYPHTASESFVQPGRHTLTARSITDFPVLIRRGSKKKNKGNSGGSKARFSRPPSASASSSTNSLQASKDVTKSSEGSQKQRKEIKTSTSTESTAQSAGPSQPQAQGSRQHKSRQNNQASGAITSPFQPHAYIYDKKSSRKQKNKVSFSQADTSTRLPSIKINRAGSGSELQRSPSLLSYSSAISRTSSEISLPRSSSSGSFFSAKSDGWTSQHSSPRSNQAGSVDTLRNPTPPESPRSSIARTQALRSQSPSYSKPPSPFANIRSQESQSVPSPSTNRRPSPFANAHLRAYSAPDLISYNSAPNPPLSRTSSTASLAARISASLPSPASPASPPPSASLSRAQLISPASALSWKTQLPISSRDSAGSASSSSLSNILRALLPDQPPSPVVGQGPSTQGSSNQRLSNQASPPRERIMSDTPAMPHTQERPPPPPPPPPPPSRLSELQSELDPIIIRPSFRFGPVGSPVRGSPVHPGRPSPRF